MAKSHDEIAKAIDVPVDLIERCARGDATGFDEVCKALQARRLYLKARHEHELQKRYDECLAALDRALRNKTDKRLAADVARWLLTPLAERPGEESPSMHVQVQVDARTQTLVNQTWVEVQETLKRLQEKIGDGRNLDRHTFSGTQALVRTGGLPPPKVKAPAPPKRDVPAPLEGLPRSGGRSGR